VATGFASAGGCWPSASVAADMYFASAEPVFARTAVGVWEGVLFTKSGGVWSISQTSFKDYPGYVVTTTKPALLPTFPVCEMSATDPAGAFGDGVALGWGVVGCCVAVLGFKWAREFLESR
jgi:hypothetical protein